MRIGLWVILFVLYAASASALTTYAFEGILGDSFQSGSVGGPPPWAVELGVTPVSGTFQYDEAAAGVAAASPGVWTFDQVAPTNITFEIDNIGWSTLHNGDYIGTSTGPGQNFHFNTLNESTPAFGTDRSEIWIQLIGGPAGSVLPGVIPTDLDQHPWTIRETLTVHGWECTVPDCTMLSLAWRLTFDLTSLTLIPEPNSALCVGLGLGVLGWRRRGACRRNRGFA